MLTGKCIHGILARVWDWHCNDLNSLYILEGVHIYSESASCIYTFYTFQFNIT